MKLKLDGKLYRKLNADGGLMKKKFKVLGQAALFNVITNKVDHIKITNTLLALRTKWLKDGYEDKTALAGRHEKDDNRNLF